MRAGLRVVIGILLLAAAPHAFAQNAADVAAGAEAYQSTCAVCHGERVISPGALPDLRKLRPEDREKFDTVVTEGKGQMPPWGGVLSEEQIGQIWAYIRSRAAN